MATIRWLGAFAHGASDLQSSLEYELKGEEDRVRCAETLKRKQGTNMPNNVRIGLLVRNSAIVRKFASDVWSEYRPNKSGNLRKLVATRDEHSAWSCHTETWVWPQYIGIVLRAGRPIHPPSLRAVREASIRFGVPIFKLAKNGELLKVRITAG